MYIGFRYWRKIFTILSFLMLLCIFNINISAVDVSGKAAILMCTDSGSILFEKNAEEALPMASTTKIMTALLTCEKIAACGNSELEITDKIVRVEGTSMGLRSGDIVRLDAIVKGMLLASGNDAANAAPIAVSGDTAKFIELMNEKAKQIGMTNTKFETPSGLDKGNHHSTAKDMAILGAYAMENEFFSEVVREKSMKVQFVNPCKTINYRNHNKLLRLYDGCIGIKTGFTKKSGRCLVSCAEKNGVRLICVTLHAQNDWDDHIKLFNYGFENTILKNFDDKNFEATIPVKGGENVRDLVVKGGSSFSYSFKKGENPDIRRSLEIPETLKAPVEKGQLIGKISYYIGDKKIGQNDVISTEYIKAKPKPIRNFFRKIGRFFKNIFVKY